MLSSFKKRQQNNRHKQNKEEIVAEEQRRRIPPGSYEAICYDMNLKQGQGGTWKVYLQFRISSGEYDGTELFMCCPKPDGKLRERHKLHKQMSLALGRPLSKGERLSKKIFINKLYTIQVRYTFRKFDETNQKMPDFMQYTVIGTILEVLTGVPILAK